MDKFIEQNLSLMKMVIDLWVYIYPHLHPSHPHYKGGKMRKMANFPILSENPKKTI